MVAIAAEGTPTTMHGYVRTQACMWVEYTIIHAKCNAHRPTQTALLAILTHARTNARTHTRTHTYTHTHTHTCTHRDTHTHTHIHIHSITVSIVKERPISRGNTAAYIHIHTHTYIYIIIYNSLVRVP